MLIIGVLAMPVTLEQIIGNTRRRVAATKAETNILELSREAQRYMPRGFARALRFASQNGVAVIAELKKASPSKGLIRGSFHPTGLGLELVNNGAAALSVLTEEEFFQGSLSYLLEASAAVHVPLLRKDFIIDEFQILEARANCADAILLIVAVLSDIELRALYQKARKLGLDVLCEVHDERELERALAAGCDIIGVNNRDLRTFKVDINTALRLGPKIPAHVLKVAESGITTGYEIARLHEVGYEAFLIGESLMTAAHSGQALSSLIQDALMQIRMPAK